MNDKNESQPMKAVILMPLAEQRGGGELTLVHLMQEGQDAGVDWLVIFFEDGPMVAQIQALGVETRVIKTGRAREVGRGLSAVTRIARQVRRHRADLIVSWMGLAHFYGSLAGLLTRTPVVWYQQGMPNPLDRIDRLLTRLPSRGILTVSKAGQAAQEKLPPPRPTLLVNPGVELDRFDPAALPTPTEARRKLGLPEHGPLIGIVGRMQKWKGIHVLIEAMPEVLQAYPDAHCVVVGGVHDLEPDYPAYLNERIAALHLQDAVIQAGLQRNVPEWMQAFDVIVHASDREPFGLVVIEALALGKPVVAGDAGGPSEVITDGKNGLLTPYGDSPALARAILKYLADPSWAADVGQAAQARAQEFSTHQYARNFIAALRSLLPGAFG